MVVKLLVNALKNKYIISGLTLLYCVCIGLLYSFRNFGFNFIVLNFSLVLVTVFFSTLLNGAFLFAIDSFIRQKVQFKARFFELTKSLWVSQLILLPVSIVTLATISFISISAITIVRIVTFAIRYICPFALLFSYKYITNSDWFTSIKVVSITFILMSTITQIFNLI